MTIKEKLEQVIREGENKGYVAFFFRSCNNCFGTDIPVQGSRCSHVTLKSIINDMNVGDTDVDRHAYFTNALTWLKGFLKVARQMKALGGVIQSNSQYTACSGVIRISQGKLLIHLPSFQHPFSKNVTSGCIVSHPGVMLLISRIHRDYFTRSAKEGVMSKKYKP